MCQYVLALFMDNKAIFLKILVFVCLFVCCCFIFASFLLSMTLG